MTTTTTLIDTQEAHAITPPRAFSRAVVRLLVMKHQLAIANHYEAIARHEAELRWLTLIESLA